MFGKLKEKLKSWTKNLSKKEEIEEKEDINISKSKPENKQKSKKEKTIKKPIKIEIPEIEETETITDIIKNSEEDSIIKQTPKQKEIIKEQQFENEKKSFFNKFTSKLNKVKISEKEFWGYAEELEILLLENNVAFEVSDKIIEKLKERIVDKEFLKKEVEFQITENLKDIIYEILIEPFDLIEKIRLHRGSETNKPFVILFCGINGTGKTTTIAKIANLLKKESISSVMAAGDTFRAASIEQLKKHGDILEINTIAHEYGSDPASVGYDAIKYAEKNNIDVVLIDTAGRMHTEKNLMVQIEKIAKVCNPDVKLFIGESITGNDIIEQVKEFNKYVKIDGIILSKADIDEKGGTALSVGYTTGKPILYLGTGQNYGDLQKFDRNKFVESLGL
jgi:fused signal recognition particle receptor